MNRLEEPGQWTKVGEAVSAAQRSDVGGLFLVKLQ